MNGGLLLNGHWIAGGSITTAHRDELHPVINPALDDATITTVPYGGPEEVDLAVQSAAKSPWRTMAPRDRARLLYKLAEEIETFRVELARLEHIDTGKPIDEADAIDIENSIRWLEYAAGWPKRIEGATLPVDGGQFTYTNREPVGVVAAITPWNYPLMIALWKIAPALAAGCPVVLKPSERAPLSCIQLGAMATEVGFPDGALNVVVGGPETGRMLLDHPHVDKVSFTGSQMVGSDVARLCAQRGRPFVTELGGKSAAIVLDSADLESTARDLIGGITHNAGQACNAPARIIVSPDRADDLKAELVRAISGDLHDFGPLIDGRAQIRVKRLVEEALNGDHAQKVYMGLPLKHGYRFPLTILETREPNLAICRREVFGPVTVIIPTTAPTLLANASMFDLAAGVYGETREAMRMARRLRAGHVYINGWSVQDPCAPFGGMGRSGIGREHGREGLDAFLQTKTVFIA